MTGLPIWDVRRGDYDDNRTSIHGGGLRGVLLSAALEFNYLKALIGFLALIVGPALLLGILPSLIVTYGRLKFGVAASAGHSPVIALIILAVLFGLALWIGRPLLAMAIENFWHLHYTLVFPIFVAVRELLRSVAERFSGKLASPEKLDHARRLCTVFGALLLAGGGLILAIAVGLSMGVQLVDLEGGRPWAVARVALGNAAVILGLSTAAESLYWVWRELTLRGPVLDWAPSPPNVETPTARVAHLSDLHVVAERYGYRMGTGTHGPRGNRCIRSALRKLTAINGSSPLERILVTGDITDAGTRAEWAEFIDLLRKYPAVRDRLSFVPGNHDVNIVDRNNPGRFDLPWSAGPSLRMLRVILALDALQGDRAHVVDRRSGALGPLLKNYLREGERLQRLRALAERGTLRGRRETAKVWDAIFPLIEPPAENGGYGVILLNSNARSHFALTNAVGVVNPSQLKALKSVLQGSPSRAWIILLHHQVVEYPVAGISLTDRIGLALVNAPDVLDAIAPHAVRCLVLHGHRHRAWIGASGDVVLGSAPSTTLGYPGEERHRGSFYIHEFALGAGGRIQLAATQRVNVSNPAGASPGGARSKRGCQEP